MISIDGDFKVPGTTIKNGQVMLPIKFAGVSGKFDCSNLGLTTLEGSPISCAAFICSKNNLKSLKFSPLEVFEGIVDVSYNKLESLIDGPKKGFNKQKSGDNVNTYRNSFNSYDCSNNNLKTLEGYPDAKSQIVSDLGQITYVNEVFIAQFDCSNNISLSSLSFVTPTNVGTPILTFIANECNLITKSFDSTSIKFTCVTFEGTDQINGKVLNAVTVKEYTKAQTVTV